MVRGRYRQAHSLYDTVQEKIRGGMKHQKPVWYDVLEAIPPSEILVRTRPVQLMEPSPKMRLPSSSYKPQRLEYPEDKLRHRFFKEHPWELARPRVFVENKGIEPRAYDWSKGLRQPGMPLCGECVVQRQMWFMDTQGMARNQAYDVARKEFYALRQLEEMEVRVQREESHAVGGYFGPTQVRIGETLEDKAYAEWIGWAKERIEQVHLMRDAKSAGNPVTDEDSMTEEPERTAETAMTEANTADPSLAPGGEASPVSVSTPARPS